MRTVNTGALKNRLSSYLQLVRKGEEVVVCDRNKPVARIVPYRPDPALNDYAAEEAYLVAQGTLKLPKEEMNWDEFWALPRPTVDDEAARKAILWAKGYDEDGEPNGR